MWAKWPGFGRVAVGPSQCLLVLEFKTHCQKCPNVSYALSPSPSEPVSLVFYRKYWWENQNKCSFDRKHTAGKAQGYFSNPGLPPLSLLVSVLASGSCWHNSSCKVPRFHLMLKFEARTCAVESIIQAIIQVHCLKPCRLWEVEVWAHLWIDGNIIEFMDLLLILTQFKKSLNHWIKTHLIW